MITRQMPKLPYYNVKRIENISSPLHAPITLYKNMGKIIYLLNI